MKKKFKVRVKHFSKGSYFVEYAYYYFIPFYWPLSEWYESINEMGSLLLDFQSAESVAKNIKSIEDVRKWEQEQKSKEEQYIRHRDEQLAKNTPYDTKYF